MDYKEQAALIRGFAYEYNKCSCITKIGGMKPEEFLLITATAITDLLARAEEAEARCETLEKMVKEYQDTIVPGYRERAEKAEAERDAAMDLIGWIYYESCVSVEHDMRQYLDWLKAKIEEYREKKVE